MEIDQEKAIEALRYAAIYFQVELEEDKDNSGAYECLCKIENVLGYQVKAGYYQ
jgi:hypothetical protein